MTVVDLLVYLVIAFLCGLAGQYLAGRTLGGRLTSTLVGLVGAVVGGWLARELGAPEPFGVVVGDRVIPVLWSIVGAAIVTFAVAFMRRTTGAEKA